MLFIRTSSHTCGRWYLPMFLFRDGLLTLMNIDSFISLERFCSSLLYYTKVVDVGSVTSGVTVVIDRGGCFKVFFKPISKCSCCLTYILFITFQPVTFKSKDHMTNKSSIIYRFKCDWLECGKDYIGETARTFGPYL